MIAGILVGSALLGIAVGSFLNVVILRLGKEKITGRSHCPHCGKTLAWWELIPLLSFFLQRGRCRSCHKKLSLQYPFVEGLTGLLFLLVSARFLLWFPGDITTNFFLSKPGWWVWPFILLWWYFSATLLSIAIYDARHYLIPDLLVVPATFIAFLSQAFGETLVRLKVPLFPSHGISFLGSAAVLLGRGSGPLLGYALLGVAVALLALGGIYFLSRGRAMGFGDVKMGVFLGLLLPWPDVLLSLFISFVTGTFVSVLLILLRRKGLKSLIPFGPFLSFGALTAMLFGDRILNAYFTLFPQVFL